MSKFLFAILFFDFENHHSVSLQLHHPSLSIPKCEVSKCIQVVAFLLNPALFQCVTNFLARCFMTFGLIISSYDFCCFFSISVDSQTMCQPFHIWGHETDTPSLLRSIMVLQCCRLFWRGNEDGESGHQIQERGYG